MIFSVLVDGKEKGGSNNLCCNYIYIHLKARMGTMFKAGDLIYILLTHSLHFLKQCECDIQDATAMCQSLKCESFDSNLHLYMYS